MSKTRWAIDGPDGTVLELNSRKFGANDAGAPMLVSHAFYGQMCYNDSPTAYSAPWFAVVSDAIRTLIIVEQLQMQRAQARILSTSRHGCFPNLIDPKIGSRTVSSGDALVRLMETENITLLTKSIS